MALSNRKIQAVYDLRTAAEEKVRAEQAVAVDGSAARRDALLDAQIRLEQKTVEAIDVCHACGHEHADGQPRGNSDNVIRANFRTEKKSRD